MVKALAVDHCLRCGVDLPSTCGFHPEGEDCMCFGTLCDKCISDSLELTQEAPDG